MLIWFAILSMVLTWMVFQSPALDYRLVALGAAIPVLEVPFGSGPLHALITPTAALALIMVATQRRRLLRRQLLGIPIGMYMHLVLDGAFMNAQVFWWPFMGTKLFDAQTPELSRGLLSGLMELFGVGVAIWAFGRFGLDDPDRRKRFLSSGQLDRSTMGPSSRGPSQRPGGRR
ncbi:MAG: hypothetical protein KDB26_09820 [Microthrixaceae bacterium]|nr:hypothetical protein [Microthrixaceae bacterium]